MSKEVKKSQKIRELNGLHYTGIDAQINHLLGKVLTIIDAIYQDELQRNAQKSLIKTTFHNQLDRIYELCYGSSPRATNSDSMERLIITSDKLVNSQRFTGL